MQSRGGKKRGKRKAEGELVVGGKSRSESESPESFFSCRLHYLMKTRKISHEETSSRTGLGTSEPREGKKKFVIFIFIFFMSTVWACCRQALKN